MIRCFILDDEPPAVNLLTQYINETPFLTLVGSSNDSVAALEQIRSAKLDILFIDIQMPKLTGFEVLEILKTSAPSVIMTTAYPEYAVSSYEFQVSDYLLKPIRYDRFLKAVTKIFNSFPAAQSPAAIEQTNSQKDDFILVKTEHRGKFKKIAHDDIRFIEGLQNYIGIHLKSQDKPIITYVRIGEIDASLPADKFIRVHKSYIIAYNEIESIDGNEIYLQAPPRIPTAGVYKDNLMEKFKSKIILGNQKKEA
jgi:two-component system, LytTR family, response regulator